MILYSLKQMSRVKLIAVSAITLFAITGCSVQVEDGDNASAVPSVVGVTLDEAATQLNDSGYSDKSIFPLPAPRDGNFDGDWTVCNQYPKAADYNGTSFEGMKLLVAEDCSVANNDGTIKGASDSASPSATKRVSPPEESNEYVQEAPIQENVEIVGDTDPNMGTCEDAIAAGYGPYSSDQPEYEFYLDDDSDGVVCEDES